MFVCDCFVQATQMILQAAGWTPMAPSLGGRCTPTKYSPLNSVQEEKLGRI